MGLNYSVTVAKQAELKQALDGKRKDHAERIRAAAGDETNPDRGALLGGRTEEEATQDLDDLHGVALKMAEAGVRGLDGSSFQVSVSGHRDPATGDAVSVAVSAFR